MIRASQARVQAAQGEEKKKVSMYVSSDISPGTRSMY
jgi:hypothetical protein